MLTHGLRKGAVILPPYSGTASKLISDDEADALKIMFVFAVGKEERENETHCHNR